MFSLRVNATRDKLIAEFQLTGSRNAQPYIHS